MLKIEITASSGDQSFRDQVDEAFAAIGFVRSAAGTSTPVSSLLSHENGDAVDASGGQESVYVPVGATAVALAVGKRERGKPGPGRQRRTREEVAEDAAADAADAARGGAEPQIRSNPEARVGPEDTPEDAAQDAVDEKAESDANRGTELTLDDVREAVGGYYAKFGMGPATADIQAIFGCKLHEIPDSQDAFGKAIAAVKDAIEKNPYGRTPVGGATAPAATLDELKVVMGRYMKTFGEDEGFADLPKVIGVARVTDLPTNPEVYAAKIKAVEEALAGNPFGRKVRS